MKLKATKTPLLIAAMATAITLTSFAPASAGTFWASNDAEITEVVPVNFKHKFKKHKFKSKKYYAPKHFKKKKKFSKSHVKKKVILKKLF